MSTVAASSRVSPRSGLDASPGAGLRKLKNSVATVLVTTAFVVAMLPLVWLLYTVINRGWHTIVGSGWFTRDQRGITYRDGGGGVLHAVVGTAEQVLLCSVISVPVAVLVAIYLVEYGHGRAARVTSFMVDILTGVPSIVAALFIYAVFVTTLGGQRSGYLVSLALVLLMIPVIVRTTEEMLKLVPDELREASYALGVPKWKTISRVVLPTAFSGIITGVMLGVARVAGETSPLLILVGYNQNVNGRLFGTSPQGSLPGMIYDQVGNLGSKFTLRGGKRVEIHYAADRLWGTALTLILIVMILNVLARLVSRTSKISS